MSKTYEYAISYISKDGKEYLAQVAYCKVFFDNFKEACGALKGLNDNKGSIKYQLNFARNWNCGSPTKLIKIAVNGQ